MRYKLDLKHKQDFSRLGVLDLEEILSLEDASILYTLGRETYAKKVKSDPYIAGRNLHIDEPKLKKILLSADLASILVSAPRRKEMHNKTLRLGYTQFFAQSNFPHLKGEFTLQEISPIQWIEGALLFSSKHPRRARLLAYDKKFTLKDIAPEEGEVVFLVVYATEKALFCNEERDPARHLFKNYGYSFSDRLIEPHNPLLQRD